MNNPIFIFLCKDLQDHTSFLSQYSFSRDNSNIKLIEISDTKYQYYFRGSDLTTALYNNRKGTTPYDYFFQQAIDLAEGIINKIRIDERIDNNTQFIFVVHWGGDEAKNKEPHLELNSKLIKQNNIQLRFASFTHTYYNKSFEELKTFLLSQIEEKKTENYNASILKKKLINTWLPLAIDIQGLSEVDEGKRESYYKGVRDELLNKKEKYYNELLDFWNSMNEFDSMPGIKKDFPSKLLDKIKETEPKNAFNLKIKESFHSKYIIDKKNFLPNWLQEVVSILDKKINAESSENSK